MKKYLYLIVLSCVLVSCYSSKYSIISDSVNLENFTKQGIFFTPGDFHDKYETQAFLKVECMAGYALNTENVAKEEIIMFPDDMYSSPADVSYHKYIFKICNYEELFHKLIIEAKKYKANGIIHYKIYQIQDPLTKRIKTTLEGTAIKIVK